MKQRRERLRQASIRRVKSYLMLPDGIPDLNLANLGIYGLGKRRTLKQLEQFVDIKLAAQKNRPREVRSLTMAEEREKDRGPGTKLTLVLWLWAL